MRHVLREIHKPSPCLSRANHSHRLVRERLASKWERSSYAKGRLVCCVPAMSCAIYRSRISEAKGAASLTFPKRTAHPTTPDRNPQRGPEEFRIPTSPRALRSLRVDLARALRSAGLQLCDRARRSAKRIER